MVVMGMVGYRRASVWLRHPREGGDPFSQALVQEWFPAFAGMTPSVGWLVEF
jgi:hypothetical protein